MRNLLTILIVLTLSLAVFSAGCSSSGTPKNTANANTITVKGSDTLVRLGQRWAEEYMKSHPGITIQVSGGGSGTGIAALLNGSTDVCEASRDMQEKEYAQAKAKGITPYRVAVALDGIAVFLNKDNPVQELSLQQLKDIFTSKITNWKDLGGKDARIILYGRENNSGTYTFFKEHVLKNADYAPEVQALPGTASVVNAVSKDVNGIGYGGLAYESNVKAAKVKKDDATPGVEPTVATVTDGSYPISRQLYWFFAGTPTGPEKDLLNWALSTDGQKIAEQTDYVPLPAELAQKNLVP